jgi:hypothetical protein
MTTPLQSVNLQDMLGTFARVAGKLNGSTLAFKVQSLRQSRSTDPIQQMQSEAIVELYDAVRQIQEAIWPILLVIPDTGAVRQAAQGGSSTSAPASGLSAASTFVRRV